MGELDRVVRDFFDVLNAGRLDDVGAALDPACEFVAPGFSGTGPDDVVGWMRPFLAAFPGIHHEVLGIVEDGDRVAFELRIAGTHSAPLVGPGGTIAATGRDVSFSAGNHWRIADGRISSYHIYFDQMGFMAQLAPAPAADAP